LLSGGGEKNWASVDNEQCVYLNLYSAGYNIAKKFHQMFIILNKNVVAGHSFWGWRSCFDLDKAQRAAADAAPAAA
jgi:hypothetical protein